MKISIWNPGYLLGSNSNLHAAISGTKQAGQEIYKVILVDALLLSKFFNFIIDFYANTDFINKFKCYILVICIFLMFLLLLEQTDLGDEEFSIVPNSYTACTLVYKPMPVVRLAVFSYSVHWPNSVTAGWKLRNLSLTGYFRKKWFLKYINCYCSFYHWQEFPSQPFVWSGVEIWKIIGNKYIMNELIYTIVTWNNIFSL